MESLYKHIVALVILCGIFSPINAQHEPVQITETQNYTQNKRMSLVQIFNYADHAFGCIMEKKNRFTGTPEYTLELYGNDLRKLADKQLDIKRFGYRLHFETMLNIGDSLYMISSYDNQQKKKKYVFAESLDRKTLEFNNDFRGIAAIPLTDGKRNQNEKLSFSLSPDKTKLSIYLSHNILYKQPYQLHVNVFDEQLKEIWHTKASLPEKKPYRSFMRLANGESHYDPDDHPYQLSTDNNGDIYISRKFHLTSDKEHQPLILHCSKTLPRGKKLKLADEELFYSSYLSRQSHDNETIILSYKPDEEAIHHSFIYQQWAMDSLIKEKTISIPKESTKELNNFIMKHSYLHTDGSISFIGEFYQEKFYRSGNSKKDQLFYHFGDIMVLRVYPETAKVIPHRISKEQRGFYKDLNYLSYTFSETPKGYHLLFYSENPFDNGKRVLENHYQKNNQWQHGQLVIPEAKKMPTPIAIQQNYFSDKKRVLLYQQFKKNIRLLQVDYHSLFQ